MRPKVSKNVNYNVPLVDKLGGVRVTSSSLLSAERMGCPWALSAGVEDMMGGILEVCSALGM